MWHLMIPIDKKLKVLYEKANLSSLRVKHRVLSRVLRGTKFLNFQTIIDLSDNKTNTMFNFLLSHE